MKDREDPLAHAARAVAPGRRGPAEHRDRCAEYKKWGDNNHERHVLGHVGIEAHAPERGRTTAHNPEKCKTPRKPEDRARERPVVSACTQTGKPHEVEHGKESSNAREHPVHLPYGDEAQEGELAARRLVSHERKYAIGLGRHVLGYGRLGTAEGT